jgi:hydrogenase expression/formation protein HypC
MCRDNKASLFHILPGAVTNSESIVASKDTRSAFAVREDQAMCLAIPGKVVETFISNSMVMARVQFGGVVREACLEYVPETCAGDYVLVHVGFAISRVNEEEAQRTNAALAELDQLSELNTPEVEEIAGGPSRGGGA